MNRERIATVALFLATSLLLPVMAAKLTPGEESYPASQVPDLVKTALFEMKLSASLKNVIERQAQGGAQAPFPSSPMEVIAQAAGEQQGLLDFDVKGWLEIAAKVEEPARNGFIQQLAVAAIGLGMPETAAELLSQGKVSFSNEDPFSWAFIVSPPPSDDRAQRDAQTVNLPSWVTWLVVAAVQEGPNNDGLPRVSRDALGEALTPFVDTLNTLFVVSIIVFVAGLILIPFAVAYLRRQRIDGWNLAVSRFQLPPLKTYLLFLTWFAVSQVLGLVVATIWPQPEMLRWVVVVAYGGAALVGVALVRQAGQAGGVSLLRTVDMDRYSVTLKAVLLGIGGWIVAVPIVFTLSWLSAGLVGGSQDVVNPVVPLLQGGGEPLEQAAIVLTVVLVAALFEEFLFRGFLFQQLRRHLGLLNAVPLTALIFASAHLSIENFLQLFGLGVILAIVYHYSQSLWACIITHGLWNLGTVVAVSVLYG